MRQHIAFLHTSPVHIATFDRLLRAADATLQVEHRVDESLLADARRVGTEDPELIERVHAALQQAAASGAPLVVCTCSTIGNLAERMPTQGRFQAARIDRAMADRAVELGPNILIVAALASTIDPTTRLIRESAESLGATVAIRSLIVPDAWRHFEAGDVMSYVTAIAQTVKSHVQDELSGKAGTTHTGVIVLAQASMAPAVECLGNIGIEVLASPELGVQAILSYLNTRLLT